MTWRYEKTETRRRIVDNESGATVISEPIRQINGERARDFVCLLPGDWPLVAAALDMFTALEKILDCDSEETRDRARSAIAKAKGET